MSEQVDSRMYSRKIWLCWVATPVILAMASVGVAQPPSSEHSERELQERRKESFTLCEKSQRLRAEGKLLEAIEAAERALAIERELFSSSNPDELVNSLRYLAGLYQEREAFPAARKVRRESLEILTKQYGPSDWRSVDARLALEDVDALAELSLDQRADVVNANKLQEQVNELCAKGRFQEALAMATQCVAIRKRLLGEHHPNYATSVEALAVSYYSLGDYARAQPLYYQALAIRRQVLGRRHPDYASSLDKLASLYKAQGDYNQAETLYIQALEIRKQVLGERHPDYANSLNNLGVLYLEQQLGYREAEAESLLRQALEIRKQVLGERHPDYAATLDNLAVLCLDLMDYTQAQSLCREALEIQKHVLGERHPDCARSMNILARLYQSQLDYVQAEPPYRDAVAIVREHLESNSVIQSERQQLAMLQSVRYYLDNYLTIAICNPEFAEPAYKEMLAWKGVLFRRQRLARSVAGDAELASVFRQLQQVVVRWARLARAVPEPKQEAEWTAEIRRLTEEKERLEAVLSARSAAYPQVMKEISPQEIQDTLPVEAVLVDFLVFEVAFPPRDGRLIMGLTAEKPRAEQHLRATVVRKGQKVEFVDLGGTGPLQDAVDTWRVDFGMSPRGAAAGALLRKRLWEPLEPRLKDATIVLVSPDQFLGRMPLGALPGKVPGTYLLEERCIAVVPVPQMIPALVTELGGKKPEKNLLLIGDVDYDALVAAPATPTPERPFDELRSLPARGHSGMLQFKRLEGMADEIAAIKDRYCDLFDHEGKNVTTLRRDQATKHAFLQEAPRHRHLHIATHGFFAPAGIVSVLQTRPGADSRLSDLSQPESAQGWSPGLLSGLALAGANRSATAVPLEADDYGILTASEIATMNLNGVRLVVLSACETGLGETAGGEGLLGLQRAFQAAGASTVIASLWAVPDHDSRNLMERFYANHWTEKMPVLEAFRQAQLAMLREGPSRRYETVDEPESSPAATQRTSPKFWAAFVVSGDWR